MLTELEKKSTKVVLYMNLTKTKSQDPQIIIRNQLVENVQNYIYLGHIMPPGKENQTQEISRRRRLIWTTFGKLKNTLNNKKIPMHLRSKINMFVLD